MQQANRVAGVRLDKWLWAARLFKTRPLAADAAARGRVVVNGHAAKAARELHGGERIELRQGEVARTVMVMALSERRGPAPVAQALYAETAESLALREQALLRRRLSPEPAASITQGRPTKRERRQLSDWNRWSATADPE